MKLRTLLVAMMLVASACNGDAGTDDLNVAAEEQSGTATTVAGNSDAETGSSVTLSNDGSTDGSTDTSSGDSNGDSTEPPDSTTVLQSGSSTSLGPTTTLQVFETDPGAEYAIPVEDIPPGQNPVYYTPFVVEKDSVEIIWDRWWWGLLDGKGDVKVLENGSVVAEGPISGSGAVQDQNSSGTITVFGPNGDTVATVTQEDLTDAIRAAQAEAGIG